MHAPSPVRELVTHLPTGTLTLSSSADADAYCAVAARANPRRGFLIVSKVLGRHLPARPSDMRAAMAAMAGQVAADVPAPVVFLGMAETATALGQGVFAAWREQNPDTPACYLQSSRQHVAGADIVARFEEGHSHATSHLVQVRDAEIRAMLAQARTLVIVDDE
jgi:Phosphoribosyl transferase